MSPMLRAIAALLAFCFLPFSVQAAKVTEVVSTKGVKAWLVEERTLPLVAVHIAFTGAGFAYDRTSQEGRATLLAQMLNEGAGDLDARAFTAALESRAITLEAGVNEDLLEISLQSLSEHKDAAFSYLALALTKPRFDGDALERVRRQSLAALTRAEQTPAYKMERAFAERAFGDHPYARPELGMEEGLRRVDAHDLRRAAERYLTRENMVIAVVGDITPEQLKTLLDTHFSDLPKQYRPDTEIPEVTVKGDGKPSVVEFVIPQTLVAFGLQGLKRDDADYITAHVMNQILGGDGLTSRLGEEIREKRGLSYGAYAQLMPLARGGLWKGTFATRNEEAETALAVLKDTLDQFAAHGPTDEELSDAKHYLTGSFVLNLDSNAALAAFLVNMQRHRLGIDYLDKRNALIEAVSRKDVQAAAKRLINTDALITVLVGKPEVARAVSP